MFNTYFEADYLLSKGALFNGAFSDRSDGKTFDCKYRALRDYEKDKSITIYLRRWKTEITQLMYLTFFDEVLEKPKGKPYKKWQFRGSKKGIEVKINEEDNWDYIVYFLPLTMSAKLKSQISNISRIHIIDYDEFFPLDNRYIKDEMTLLLEFWKSIDRDRETTQLLILGNKITPFNPFFDYFNISLDIIKDKMRTYRDGTLAIQIYSNKEHREERESGKFKSLIKGTSYEDYDCGGVLKMYNLKQRTHEGFTYFCSFKTSKGSGTLWYNNGDLVVSDYKRQDGFVLCDKIYNTGREEYLANYDEFSKMLKSIYRRGSMYFENDKCLYAIEDIMKLIGSSMT